MNQQPPKPPTFMPGHPGKNYLRPSQKPNIINLNDMMKTSGGNQPKYKESDEFISKKVLMNIKGAQGRVDIVNDENYKKYAKKIKDVKIDNGKISYMLEGSDKFLEESVLEMNYVLNFQDKLFEFYQQNQNVEKPKTKTTKKK